MGFVLTLLYIFLALLSPADLFPSLAPYRIELAVAVLALLFSAPSLLDTRFFRIPQVYLLGGLFAAVFLSVAIGGHWVGGGVDAVVRFVPAAIVFYLVVLNCHSPRRIQVLVSLLAIVAIAYVIQGARAYFAGDVNSQLLKVIPVGDGGLTFRMQGLGFLRDPNELAQFLVMIVPFLWTRWREGRYVQNLFMVIAPSLILVWGVYLTHSRGAVMALVVILMVALKDRLSLISTVIAGALGFAALVALDFSGGREISVEAGSDRLALWGDGLRLFSQSPLFGIGYQTFAEQNAGHTAHNSFVVCLTELGTFGYAFWVALLVFTLWGLSSLISSLRTSRESIGDEDVEEDADSENAELGRLANAVRISLIGFLAAAFFLSRAFVLPLYLSLGVAAALVYFASDEEEEPLVFQPILRLLTHSAGWGLAAIAVVYASLKLRGFL